MTGNPIDSVISDIARKIDDYVDFPKFSSDKRHDDVKSHVAKWGSQFGNDMDFVLRHTRNVLSRRYFSLEDYNQKLTRIARNEANLHNFENDCLLDIQTRGGSQHQLVSALNKKIKEEVGIDMPIISAGDDWSKVDYSKYECLNYLDDFSFSSKLVGDDIINFIEVSGVENVTIRIVLFVAHTHGMFDLKRRLTKFIANREKEKGKKINISFIFNKQFWELISNSIADDMTSKSSVYLAERELADSILLEHGLVGSDLYTPNVFRVGNHRGCILGDDDDRRRIERIFISKGLYIASHSNDLSRSLKPLGFYSYPGFGFGGNAFSYRNCPNNTPLVFWWGTYTKTGNSAIDCWYPLMKRTGYQL